MKARLTGEIVLTWGDGEYNFALKGRQIEQLEKEAGAGIGVISRRVMMHECTYSDIRNIIHLGLEGGGMPPVTAAEKMRRFFDGQPLAGRDDPSSPLATAVAIISAAWFGVEDLKTVQEGDAGSGENAGKFSAAGFRGKMMEMGADPRYVDESSMYEVLSTFEAAAGSEKGLSETDHRKMLDALAERKKRMGLS